MFCNQKTWLEARETCCSIGLTLLSLDSDQKNKCFKRITTRKLLCFVKRILIYYFPCLEFSAFTDDEYWTSGSDSDCPSNYFWCSKEAQFVKSQVFWKAKHPDPAIGNCVHVQVAINDTKQNLEMGTSSCADEKYFVCEVRQVGTTGRGLALECMALWDITEGIT